MNLTLEYALYFMSVISVSFWVVIWIMHICALTNARLKLNKRSCTSAASRRKRKLEHLKDKFLPCITKKNKNLSLYPLATDNTIDNTGFSNFLTDDKSKPNRSLQTKMDLCIEQPNSNTTNMTATTTLSTIDGSIHGHDTIQHQPKKVYSCINLPLPGVSIIKPLVGVDANLQRNLDAFFHMDYPTYELLFCVQDPDDPAILVVKNLFKLYPGADAKLFIGGARVGVNPKINNMQPAYEAVKYELVLVSDSGIFMKRDTLLDMVSHMHDDVALVHQMPFVYGDREGFQSIVETVYFGTAHARAYLTADLLSINCPTGMSALMRKCLLDEVGGIKTFGLYLAEDFFFAKSFTDRGWKISISSQPAWQNSANSGNSLSTLNCRIQRWIKLRFAMVPHWTILEPFSECMLLGSISAMSVSFLWAINPFAVFIIHVLIWFICDYKLLCTIQNGALTFSLTDFVIAWLIRECTALLIFLKALTNSKVTWRSRIFRLKRGGYAEEIPCENDTRDLNHAKSVPEAQTHTNEVIFNQSLTIGNRLAPQVFCTEQAYNITINAALEINTNPIYNKLIKQPMSLVHDPIPVP